MNTRKICGIAILTALYVVMSAFIKIPFIGNISLDLGYIVFGVACCMYGVWGTVVGAVGCGIESLLFSAYGFSPSWFVGNLIIGLICGLVFGAVRSMPVRIGTTVGAVAIGILVAKTCIESYLYSIPLMVKIPKNAVAFVVDSIVMIGGIYLANILEKRKIK